MYRNLLHSSAALTLTLALANIQPAQGQGTASLNNQLDAAIQAACHSYLVDALPNALSWLQDQIYKNSPFCNKALKAHDNEELGDLLQERFQGYRKGDVQLDLSKKHDRDLNVTIECDSEYMCMESRLKYQDTDHPVSQKDYDQVRDYCLERYGCIQAFFTDWPQSLPVPQKAEDLKLVSFDSLLQAQAGASEPPSDDSSSDAEQLAGNNAENQNISPRTSEPERNTPPSSGPTPEPEVVVQPSEQTETVTAAVATTTATAQEPAGHSASNTGNPNLHVGPANVNWEQAGLYCRNLGMRLPTVAEARANIRDFKLYALDHKDVYYFKFGNSYQSNKGLWTSEASYLDAYVQQYKAVHITGHAEGTHAHQQQIVICVS
ncbi:hypothetical protein [Kiloniella sp. b19]|uniref:hypothetical protein n=1 Tax=Kiloniella sp. GXU_MW_B19 TaxID=3141326 RepID=UPI0031D8B484